MQKRVTEIAISRILMLENQHMKTSDVQFASMNVDPTSRLRYTIEDAPRRKPHS